MYSSKENIEKFSSFDFINQFAYKSPNYLSFKI